MNTRRLPDACAQRFFREVFHYLLLYARGPSCVFCCAWIVASWSLLLVLKLGFLLA